MKRSLAAALLALPLLAAEGDVLDALLTKGAMTRADLSRAAPAAAPFALPFAEALRADPLALPAAGEELRRSVERRGSDAAALLLEAAVRPRFPRAAMPEPPGAAADLDLSGLPEPLRAPVARLVAGLLAADAEVRRAWSRVPPEVARAAARDRSAVPELADAARAHPALEEAARLADGEALARAGLLAASAVLRAARDLRGVEAPSDLRWETATPAGKVRVSGSASDRHDAKEGPFLAIVDLGGDDTYSGSLAAGIWPEQPVSAVIDMGGNDRYEADDAAQGCGLGGVGVLLDAAGSDRYRARSRAQGFAQLGVGVLADLGGDDEYAVEDAGQGAALFGSALLLDAGGDDVYTLFHDGQGFGGPGGVGLLADLSGRDRYVAVRDPARAGRPDPKSDGKAATSNAQGVGLGRYGRGDAAWAGGLGALADLAGDDAYSGGTWCQGAGYWHGTGILVDGGGDDVYEAVWYAQGSAAHAARGLLLDVAGNDRHALVGTGGAGLGFGWDFAVGMLVDLAGNDVYRAERLALGAAMQRSLGLFLDAGGDDAYEVAHPEEALGFVDEEARWSDPAGGSWFAASQAGLFLDLGGNDRYPEGRGANGSTWSMRTSAPRNLGAGYDGAAAVPIRISR